VPEFVVTAAAAFVGAVLGALAKQIFDYTAASRTQKAARRDIWEHMIVQAIDELAECTCLYWSSIVDDGEAAKIEGRARGIMIAIEGANDDLFKERVEVKRLCDSSLHAVRRAITGGTFECAERQQDLDRVREIQTACAELKRLIQGERAKLPLPLA
jgi:hypothetical protein